MDNSALFDDAKKSADFAVGSRATFEAQSLKVLDVGSVQASKPFLAYKKKKTEYSVIFAPLIAAPQ